MPASQDYIDGLVANPLESLTVEIKDWFDPRSAQGQAKIVKGCIALRNNDGGFFQIGFQNGTWVPNAAGAPSSVRAEWDGDDIQNLVNKYASESFSVHVRFGERDGKEFPVLEIESGFRTPIASRADLFDPTDSTKKLVKEHAVYVRSFHNGTVSTAEAKHDDWADLIEGCFNNREADIGSFMRRHLSGLSPSILREVADALEASAASGAPRAS